MTIRQNLGERHPDPRGIAAECCKYLQVFNEFTCIEERKKTNVDGGEEDDRPAEEKLDFVIHEDTVLDVRGIEGTRGTSTIYTVLTIKEWDRMN